MSSFVVWLSSVNNHYSIIKVRFTILVFKNPKKSARQSYAQTCSVQVRFMHFRVLVLDLKLFLSMGFEWDHMDVEQVSEYLLT